MKEEDGSSFKPEKNIAKPPKIQVFSNFVLFHFAP